MPPVVDHYNAPPSPPTTDPVIPPTATVNTQDEGPVFGSAATSTESTDVPPPPIVTGGDTTPTPSFVPMAPKPKFGGGKAIATIFGILFLAAAVAGGTYLVQQNQEFREKAGEACPDGSGDIVACVSWNCPNGDTNGDRQCTSADSGATTQDLWLSGSGCSSSCGQVDYYKVSGDWTSYCGHTYTGNPPFPNCAGPTAPPDGPTPPPGGDVCVDSETCSDGSVCPGGQNCFRTDGGDTPDPGDDVYGCREDPACTQPTNPPTPHPTPTDAPITASCKNIKAFDANWVRLDDAGLAALKAGAIVKFTVRGETTEGEFTKARFTINGVLLPITRLERPGVPKEFYIDYTVPSGVTKFTVGAEIYHKEKDKWF